MKSEIKTAVILIAAIAVGVGALSAVLSTLDEDSMRPVTDPAGTATGDAAQPGDASLLETAPAIIDIPPPPGLPISDKSRAKAAPDLVGIADYLNTTPEALAEDLEGKVVLYDIWTYSCINCIRTLPYITAWDDKYADQGLLIVGIHSPEFEFEKDVNNVRMAVEKYDIQYPVVLDNDKETWKAFENRYWPRKYVADHEGNIRYDHIGEGRYQETEKVIQYLLEVRAASLGVQAAHAESLVDIEEFRHSQNTPELYFGYYFAQGRNNLGSPEGFQPGQTVTYAAPDRVDSNKFYPVGMWKNLRGSMELAEDAGAIYASYHAKQVNIVTANPAELEIFLDGKPIPPEFAGTDIVDGNILRVSEPRLYNVVDSDASERHLLEMRVSGQGFQIFTFTFG